MVLEGQSNKMRCGQTNLSIEFYSLFIPYIWENRLTSQRKVLLFGFQISGWRTFCTQSFCLLASRGNLWSFAPLPEFCSQVNAKKEEKKSADISRKTRGALVFSVITFQEALRPCLFLIILAV